MRIVLVSDTYHPSVNGAAYFTYRLANSLASRHEVHVICPSAQFAHTKKIIANVTVWGMKSLPLPVYEKFRICPSFIVGKAVEDAILRIKPDIIHIQNHFLLGKAALTIAKSHGIPIVGTNHFMPDNLLDYFPLSSRMEAWLKSVGWRQCIRVYQQLDRVTTPTKTAATVFAQAGFRGKITAISCGLDLSAFKQGNDGEYLRTRYGIPTGLPILLYVGRLDKDKQIDVIVNAMPLILKHLKVHLVVTGIGKDRTLLEQLCDSLGLSDSVTFTGFVADEDIGNVFALGTIFVMASTAELQSIATMEAMASGLPIVAANAVALPELVHEGENGFLFNPGDRSQLAQAVLKILQDDTLRHKMSLRSMEIVQDRDVRQVARNYEQLYEEVIALKTKKAMDRG